MSSMGSACPLRDVVAPVPAPALRGRILIFKSYRMQTPKQKSTHGGRRPGAGNPGTPRVEERRVQVALTVLPRVVDEFKKKYGRAWARRVETFMVQDLE